MTTPVDDNTAYVKWFRNSAPYINAHRGKTFVLMFGGEAVEHPNFATIVHDIALLNSLGVRTVLVHGARPQIEAALAAANIPTNIHDGVRITDNAALRAVKGAIGSLRTDIEALLSMGLANSPMHGAQLRVCSGNFVTARPRGVRDGVDYMHTGEVRRIDAEGIARQLAEGTIVLLSSQGYSPTGELFNLTGEEVATRAAIDLHADKLIVLTDQPGLLDAEGELIRYCEVAAIQTLLAQDPEEPFATALRAVMSCCLNGVPRAHLIDYRNEGALLQELFTRDGAGTLVTQEYFEQLRPASIEDVGGILELIEPLEREGILVKRSREVLEREIHHFTVIDRDGMIIACAALYPNPDEGVGEIACVVTHPDYRARDRGLRLMAALEKTALQMGLHQVFVLTTRTAHWFQEQGFVIAELDTLPDDRRQLYNFQRNSKVFVKALKN